MTVKVNRITHDNQMIAEKADQLISSMSVRTKYKTQSVISKSTRSHKSSSHASIYTRSSSRSAQSIIRSSSSSVLRLRTSEAAAKVAEKEAQLETEQKTKQIEQELSKLESQKRELQLRGELEAERRKVAIFQLAITDEEQPDTGLMSRLQDEVRRPLSYHEPSNTDSPNSLPNEVNQLRIPRLRSHMTKTIESTLVAKPTLAFAEEPRQQTLTPRRNRVPTSAEITHKSPQPP